MKYSSSITVLLFLLLVKPASAQEPDLDSVKTILYEVNKVFDSSRYLAFDVQMLYRSDTSFGRFESDAQQARYVINDKHLYFAMNNDEYVQTDSFLFNIYHDDQLIVMSRQPAERVSNRFPLREFLDSILTIYDSAYAIRAFGGESMHRVTFVAKNDSLPYSRFAIAYAPDNFLPTSIEIETLGYLDLTDVPDSLIAKVSIKPVRQRVEMIFENYSFPDNPNIFG